MTSSHADSTQAHYDRLAASYDQNWAYSPAYIAWMSGCILDRAAIQPGQVVADIGSGTGLYSSRLAAAAGRVICADPSQAMLDQLPDDPSRIPVRASAQDIAARRTKLPAERLDVIVMKEAIHHVPASDRATVLRGLAGCQPCTACRRARHARPHSVRPSQTASVLQNSSPAAGTARASRA